MKILIYGTGCANCEKLYKKVLEVIESNNLNAEVEKVTNLQDIMQAQVLQTPALSIDGKIIGEGKLFSTTELTELLTGKRVEKNKSCSCACQSKKSCFTLKKLLTLLILLLICAGTTMAILRELKPIKETPQQGTENQLVVYYFHGDKRCYTCNKIEQQAKAILEERFSTFLTDKKLIFKSVNIDEKANEHFLTKFDLSSGTVVVTLNNRFEKLDQVWDLVNDKEAFEKYVVEHIQAFSKEKI